ncbi:MAG: D-alanyl-D-alanine carboxypeptidase/D-alanyl-D-alanine-endopeptidase [Spirochaetes bacterium]|nr:D-alanyl-D-alanine carboxypeptidase/D-alanyl-D-alanine-endopeptidase [Spirochaetota bacterium]
MTRHCHVRIAIAILSAALLQMRCGGFNPANIDLSRGPDAPHAGAESDLIRAIRPDTVGYILYDLDKKRIVRAHNRSRAFIPASTTKVLSALTALDVLGPDYRFSTSLSKKGSIDDGVLDGDLYLSGGGDPLLTVSDLMDLADALKNEGVTSVSGSFRYDESDLVGAPCIDAGMETDVSYNPGISALSLDHNAITAEWKRDKAKTAMEIFLTPDLPMHSAGISAGKLKENVRFDYQRNGSDESWLLSPEEDRDGNERLPVKRPALYTAQVFAKICGLRGIRLPRPEPGKTPASAGDIAVHRGQSLDGIADLTLTYSMNLSAELLMLKSAKELAGKAMPLQESACRMARHFTGTMPRVRWDDFRLVNGSGLTVMNRITPEQMAAILIYADSRKYNGRKYRSFLPASGWEWSLLSRLDDPDTAFHVWAKTGSINYALALAGYLYTKSGRPMAFAIFISDEAERARYDADPDRRSRTSAKKVTAWMNNSKNLMDGIVSSWIKEL